MVHAFISKWYGLHAPHGGSSGPPERGGEEEVMAISGKDELTPGEREELELLKKRLTNEEITTELVISLRTAEAHVANVLQKLGYKDRRELWRDIVG